MHIIFIWGGGGKPCEARKDLQESYLQTPCKNAEL